MTKAVKNPPPVLDDDAKLDEALEETFPASDPIAMTPTTIGSADAGPAVDEPKDVKRRPRPERRG